MKKEEVIKVDVAKGEYIETYAPFPKDPKAAEDKVKRGILKTLGMKEEEIDKIVDDLELEADNGGADGRFDDGPYTPVKLVRIIRREPRIIDIPDPIIEKPEKEPVTEPRQTMLDQYYGDRDAEMQRRKKFDRFKSHITKKEIDVYDEDGTKRKLEVYTIEDYKYKSQDSDDLLLDGYQTKLERLSRAHQRDFAPYRREYRRLKTTAIKEIMEKYEEMHEVKPIEAEKFKQSAMEMISSFDDEEFEKKAIQALIDKDTEFIETNNYTYNTRQNTAENLKTLGKYGEKSVKAQISDEQSIAQKFGLKTMNALISIRNHTSAPVNKVVGTYVASPLYRAFLGVKRSKSKEPVNVDGFYITPMEDMLAISQKHSRGMFTNKPTHRYHARKDFFINQEAEEMQRENGEESEGKVKRTTLGKLIKMAIVPRVKAIVNYKEGNVAILNAGLHDIEEATHQRNLQMKTKRHREIDSLKRIASYEKEIDDLRALEKFTKDPVEKEKIRLSIEQRETYKLKLEARYAETSRTEVDSISTDAISMSQHDKANKANVTGVVRGVKTAGRVATGVLISKYLYREVPRQVKTPDKLEYVPGKTKTVEEEVIERVTETVPGMDPKDVEKITLDDIYSQADGTLSHHITKGGRTIIDQTNRFNGAGARFRGKLISGSDGKGFDSNVLTDTQIDQPITGDSSVVSIYQEIIQDVTGEAFSTEEVAKMFINGEITDISLWRAIYDSGVGEGWSYLQQAFNKIIQGGSHEVTRDIVKIVEKTIETPGKYIFKPGMEVTQYITELNPVVVAAEAGLAAMEVADWNELLRYTRSQESIHMRQPRTLAEMKAENDKLRAQKNENQEKENNSEDKPISKGKKSKEEIKKRREIKSFQRNNKSKQRRYTHFSQEMKNASERESEKRKSVTVFEGFVGSKKGDLNSGYDENLIGVNRRPVELENENEERY